MKSIKEQNEEYLYPPRAIKSTYSEEKRRKQEQSRRRFARRLRIKEGISWLQLISESLLLVLLAAAVAIVLHVALF